MQKEEEDNLLQATMPHDKYHELQEMKLSPDAQVNVLNPTTNVKLFMAAEPQHRLHIPLIPLR